jgi:hypothetical protein
MSELSLPRCHHCEEIERDCECLASTHNIEGATKHDPDLQVRVAWRSRVDCRVRGQLKPMPIWKAVLELERLNRLYDGKAHHYLVAAPRS